MKRNIIRIDSEKCVGCGLCAGACNQGAIGIVDGKAKLLREDYCDGLGKCLPVCPTGAITMEEREAAAGVPDTGGGNKHSVHEGCPGSRGFVISTEEKESKSEAPGAKTANRLAQWPVQIQLVPVNAPYFKNAALLVAADCSAYAYAGFHEDFMRGKITVIGCPKLDDTDYSEKLTAIIKNNDIKSVTVVRMEVPCCGGIEHAVKTALINSGKMIPWQVVTLSADGKILENL